MDSSTTLELHERLTEATLPDADGVSGSVGAGRPKVPLAFLKMSRLTWCRPCPNQ